MSSTSLFAQSLEDQIALAQDVTASRVLDVVLQSPTVSFKDKRKFVMNFIGHYETLVDDRIGSRVGDNCWAFADTYLKVRKFRHSLIRLPHAYAHVQEKIARSLVRHERDLAASFYGKFFARRLNIHLLLRDPEQWKNLQINVRSSAQPQAMQESRPVSTAQSHTATPDPQNAPAKLSKKRKARVEDEIDQLFEEKLGKKVKKAGLGVDASAPSAPKVNQKVEVKEKKRRKHDAAAEDRDLQDVLGAIKAAPKDDKSHKRKKKA